MSKTVKYAKTGAVVGGLVYLAHNVIKQLIEMDKVSHLKFDWGELFIQTGKGALLGGATGTVIGGVKDIHNSTIESLDTDFMLSTAITGMTLDKNSKTYKLLSSKAEKISNFIDNHYSKKLGGPLLRIGSTEEDTALASNFDIDISVPFAASSFSSTQLMFDDLYNCLNDSYDDIDLIEIRGQRKSIGLLFDLFGKEFKIDVVPYKLSPTKGNNTSGYLFVNNNSFFESDSYTKTDINILKSVKLTPTQQKILVAIKSWKQNFDVPIGSHLVKLFILDAYKVNRGKIPRGFTDKLLMVVHHIRNEINFKKIVSLENSNNVLTDLSKNKKSKITRACDKVLEEYEYQPNSILDYFS